MILSLPGILGSILITGETLGSLLTRIFFFFFFFHIFTHWEFVTFMPCTSPFFFVFYKARYPLQTTVIFRMHLHINVIHLLSSHVCIDACIYLPCNNYVDPANVWLERYCSLSKLRLAITFTALRILSKMHFCAYMHLVLISRFLV